MVTLLNTLRVTGRCPDLLDIDPNIEQLIIEDCLDEVFIPDLPGLQRLTVIGCPDVIVAMVAPGLKSLSLQNCAELQYLPEMPESLETMELKDCPKLQLGMAMGGELELLIVDRCPTIDLDTLPPAREYNFVNLQFPNFPEYSHHLGLEKLVFVECYIPAGVLDICSLRELVVDRCLIISAGRPLYVAPGVADRLISLKILKTNLVMLPHSMVNLEELALDQVNKAALPQMPKLHTLELFGTEATTNEHEVKDIFDYRQVWGARRAKRPTRRSDYA